MKALNAEMLREPLQHARRFAALSGPFDPLEAPLGDPERPEVATLATLLAESCDLNPAGADGRWLMRPAERAEVFRSWDQVQLRAAAQARLADADPETRDMLSAILEIPPFDRRSLLQEIEHPSSRPMLDRIVLALDRAAKATPNADLLVPARSAVSNVDARERAETIAKRPFVGRKSEMDAIGSWVVHPYSDPPVHCLFVTGGPGIGKSTLLAKSLLRAAQRTKALVLRLDFDRAGLDVQDRLGLTMEAARQIGEQLGLAGAGLLEMRLDAGAGFAPRSSDSFSQSESAAPATISPEDLLEAIGSAVRGSGRPVLIILDTLEVLRGRGESAPATLFNWIDDLVINGVSPVSVVAAGRGDALDGCTDRFDEPYVLPGLEDAEAASLLQELGVPAEFVPDLIAIGEGSPLRLRLAATVFERIGPEAFARLSQRRRIDEAFLYRFLLSRIEDPLLQKLAHPGLIVRRINAALIQDVLAPNLGMSGVTRERAAALLKELSTHHWLMEDDPDPAAKGFLKHRSDMRALLLPVLYKTASRRAARINRAAAAWFAAQSYPWAKVEAAYHQLQLMRLRGAQAPAIAWEVLAQIDDDMLDELPDDARDYVLTSVGRRGTGRRGPAAGGPPDEAVILRELTGILGRSDWAEGSYLINQVDEERRLDPASTAADAVRAVLWRSGRWAAARRWLADRDLVRADDGDLGSLDPALALPRLEMLAEFEPRRLVRWCRAQQSEQADLAKQALVARDNVARHGALGLLLAQYPHVWPMQKMRDSEGNLPAAVLSVGTGETRSDDFLQIRRLAWDRLNRHFVDLHKADEVGAAILFSTLTPYARMAGNLAADPERSWLPEDFRRLYDPLTAAASGRLGARPRQAVGAPLSHSVDDLADIGLFAEWAGLSAWLRPDPDLALIARCAERWRRTVAGRWSLIERPRGWQQQTVDRTSAGELDRLLGSGDPRAAAERALGQWSEVGDWSAEDPARALTRRLRRSYRRLIGMAGELAPQGPQVVLQRLLQGRMPAALAPAVAILIHDGSFAKGRQE